MNESQLEAGLAALKAGKKREARRIFGDVIRVQPEHVAAWWYLSDAVDDPAQKIQCLRQVIRLQPDHLEAYKLLASLEPRMPTPPRGMPRPVYDVASVHEHSILVSDELTPQVEEDGEPPPNRNLVALGMIGVLLLLAISATTFAFISGFAAESLGISDPRLEPTPKSLAFGLQACTANNDPPATLIFINETAIQIEMLRGPEGQEDALFELAPGEEEAIETTPGRLVRFVARTDVPGYTTSGALFEVPSGSVCRVPIN